MRIFKRLFSVFFAVVSVFNLSACVDKGSVLDFSCFNTYVHIQTQSTTISKTTENEIKNLFDQLETEFDAYNQNSLVYKFNATAQGTTFNLSEHAVAVLSAAKEVSAFTDGAFDPTVYPLVELWGFAPYKHTLSFTPPTAEQISSALAKVGFNKIALSVTDKTLMKTDAEVKIDLGGIVKGYAADKAAEILKADGHYDGYVSVGGSSLNLLAVDTLGVRHPKNTTGNAILSVNLKGKKDLPVSTSGNYEKYYKDETGKTYCHIINPKTGQTADTGVSSVTVIGVDGLISDALTTAGCLCAHDVDYTENSALIEFLKKIIAEYPDCQVFAVYSTESAKLLITNKKQGEDFTLQDDSYSVVNI